MMEAHDVRYIRDENFVRTIPIPTLGVKTTDFDLSREKSEALMSPAERRLRSPLPPGTFRNTLRSIARDRIGLRE
jgi:NTE family protein